MNTICAFCGWWDGLGEKISVCSIIRLTIFKNVSARIQKGAFPRFRDCIFETEEKKQLKPSIDLQLSYQRSSLMKLKILGWKKNGKTCSAYLKTTKINEIWIIDIIYNMKRYRGSKKSTSSADIINDGNLKRTFWKQLFWMMTYEFTLWSDAQTKYNLSTRVNDCRRKLR